MAIKHQPYNIRIKDNIVNPPVIIQNIITIIKQYEDCGYLRIVAIIDTKRNDILIHPLFEERHSSRFFPKMILCNGNDGATFIKYLESLW